MYESKDLVNAIFCSIAKLVERLRLPLLEHGSTLAQYALVLNQQDYEFRNVTQEITSISWNKRSPLLAKAKEFCVVALLGTGRTAKAFRAFSVKDGIECVVKMYVRKFDEANNYAAIKKKDYKRAGRDSMNREKQRYQEIYGITVYTVELYGHHCLVLPFF